ncbi:MBL fold metallo-hydrolase [Robertkochia flava]|uniref:MBL fold metallo-hydrolase n=1 Tax=Robertkochia flava TaxID=3447986 RepID=UPI001CCBE112|nr:MBL fold metallo-hydrolase [Robertkochia marina]
MKTHLGLLLSFLFLLSLQPIVAQENAADVIGDITIQPIVHGTLAITWKDQTIYVDPYGGAERFSEIAAPTLVLITDIHGDHYNEETLNALPVQDAHFVVPQAVHDLLPDNPARATSVIGNGEKTTVNGIGIETIPMYNLPETEESRHPKGRGNGYILTLGDQRIYISGDTEDIPEMRNLENIDVAFICMNMPYTMTVEQAASAVNDFKPHIVYPYHYRGRPEISDTEKFKALVEAENKDTEVRLRNWYTE